MVLWGSLIDDRYRIEDELGRGGFGAVYRAKQVVLGTDLRDVALKLFHEGAVGPDNLLEKMNDAISLIGVLNQIDDSTVRQHFIDVYDLGATRGEKPQAFVAMELVRGGSLQRRLHCFGKFNVEQTRDYLIQITRAIGFMHTLPKPVLHRDLKPDNLLLVRHDAGDVVKVADFGLAGAMDGALAVGHAAGALEYMAPEGFDWDTAVPASDVYSIGLIAYEMLFGEHPFAGVGRGLKHDDPKSFGELREMHGNLRRYGVQITKEKAAEARNDRYTQLGAGARFAPTLSQRAADARGAAARVSRRPRGASPPGRGPKADEGGSQLPPASRRLRQGREGGPKHDRRLPDAG
jgi:serine/threonine protein kinase